MSLNRQQIRERFRQENPDISERSISDDVLNLWINEGNKEFATDAKCIIDNLSFTTVADQRNYDLTTLSSSFFDIDEVGGGVWYDDKYLLQSSQAQLANKNIRWRENLAGEPRYWYRIQNTLYLDKNPEASKTILVTSILLPNDLTSDSDTPFNGLGYLAPFHYGLVVYLQWKAKIKLGKDNEALTARTEYEIYVKKTENLIDSDRVGSVSLQPRSHYYQPGSRYRGRA